MLSIVTSWSLGSPSPSAPRADVLHPLLATREHEGQLELLQRVLERRRAGPETCGLEERQPPGVVLRKARRDGLVDLLGLVELARLFGAVDRALRGTRLLEAGERATLVGLAECEAVPLQRRAFPSDRVANRVVLLQEGLEVAAVRVPLQVLLAQALDALDVDWIDTGHQLA
jgi:hypothetical protein